MTTTKEKLVEAEQKALQLFNTIEDRNIIAAGKSENQSILKFISLLLSYSELKNTGTKELSGRQQHVKTL